MTTLPLQQVPSAAATLVRWQIGPLNISFGAQPAALPPHDGAELLIPSRSPLTLHQETVQQILRPPLDVLYLPAGEKPLHTSAYQGWRLSFDLGHLCTLAAEMAQHRLSAARFRRVLSSMQLVQPRHSPERELCQALLQLVQLTAAPTLHRQQHLALAGLDRAIQRMLVVVLCGEQIEAALGRGHDLRGMRSEIFDELLEWIEANLDRPIMLRDLTERSGYSERSIRNFFQERFHCGPTQWIRQRRLEAARQKLLNPEPHDSVSSIAASFGYLHLSQFSRDFHNTFQQRPSELLREGQRQRRSP